MVDPIGQRLLTILEKLPMDSDDIPESFKGFERLINRMRDFVLSQSCVSSNEELRKSAARTTLYC